MHLSPFLNPTSLFLFLFLSLLFLLFLYLLPFSYSSSSTFSSSPLPLHHPSTPATYLVSSAAGLVSLTYVNLRDSISIYGPLGGCGSAGEDGADGGNGPRCFLFLLILRPLYFYFYSILCYDFLFPFLFLGFQKISSLSVGLFPSRADASFAAQEVAAALASPALRVLTSANPSLSCTSLSSFSLRRRVVLWFLFSLVPFF